MNNPYLWMGGRESNMRSPIHADILSRYYDLLERHIELNPRGRYGLNGVETSFDHMLWMLAEIRTMTDPLKAHRWLGFVQGVIIANGLTTVQAERDFTRSYFKGEVTK